MISDVVVKEAEKSGAHYLYGKGALYSVTPPESMFGYTIWAHMIPPFRPESALILGYGGGTVAELIRKIWGQCKITGVDMEIQKNAFLEYKLKCMDAKKFVWDCTTGIFKSKFDYVCIDLWDGHKVPDFIFETEFVVRLREMTKKLISMNIHERNVVDTKNYYDYGFSFDRVVPIESNRVLWWSVQDEG